MLAKSYQLVIVFTVLSVIGLALLPRLSVQLAPQQAGRSITVSYAWWGASPEAIERQVSSRLEGAFSTLANVKKVRSVSAYNRGYVTVELDRSADTDALRFELAALVRQVYPRLPPSVEYPQISLNTPDEESRTKPLLTLQLSGPVSSASLQQYANEQLKPRLAGTEGIGSVAVFGGSRPEWVLTYNADALTTLQLTENDLRVAVTAYFAREPLGLLVSSTGQTLRVRLDNVPATQPNVWAHIPVANRAGRIIYLTDLVSIARQEPPPDQFYRINGKTAVNLVLMATAGANQLAVAQGLRKQLAQLVLPAGYRLDVDYDATVYIAENLRKIGIQTGVAIAVLLLFVALTTRSLRYVSLIVVSTVVTLLLSVLVFVWLRIDIHLYSLAALTTSLGIIMDNVIVMIDHYRRYRDLRVFTALLGGTLTTCAGLVVVWFLPEENRQALSDFAVVMAITLVISLLVAMLLTPALMEQFWKNEPGPNPLASEKHRKRAKRTLWWERLYGRVVAGLIRYRLWAMVAAVLLIGLPVFRLPTALEPTNPLAPYYKATLGSDFYADNLQPSVNKWLGGTSRLFVNYVYAGSYQREPERTALYVIAELPNQSTPEQMDAVFRRFESNLGQYGEIDKFITQINNGQEGSLVVYFKEPHDQGIFPYQLKNRAILLSTEMSGIDWNIYGLGQGFSQSLNEDETPTFNVELYGYNYLQLGQQATVLKQLLEKHPRIQEVNINRSPSLFQRRRLYEFVLKSDPERLALRGIGSSQLYDRLAELNARPQPDQYAFIDGDYEPIKLIPAQSRTTDIWQLQNQPLTIGSASTQLHDMGTIVRQKVTPEIHKEDQQYKRLISFEYFGSYNFGEKFLNKTLDTLRARLPLGYTANVADRFWFGKDERTPYELIGLVILLIYIICAVIFESFWQPLALIGLIPLSYTGVFLAFYWTDSNFDQGGYASFILLAGNVVCAGIFMVAEMNRLQKRFPSLTRFAAYQKAFRHKIGPVLLTVLSTVVGMVPFLLYEQEAFWYALGIGTIGGLLMSLVAVTGYLPLFLVRRAR
ncbi:efflux RND transporter permease subunit [Spirosoma fluviale]|uniref:Multidrug efflux pump subunit AcrB n=1 Tax=Spirosoma fluviale TaxID=1597977 RepID=A0A286FIH3_9BACT|nr:efflux RND transporter permease subunit [Spirosoma fluviale]SOD83025.1 Multidrug efflux pump subunit AcrB [Spirosoma fluviale]